MGPAARDRSGAPGTERALSSLVGVLLVVVGGALTFSVFETTRSTPEPAPTADIEFEFEQFGDGVPKNDTVVVTHVGGDRLEREHLEVVVGDDVVYNVTGDSESTTATFTVPGLVVEVDGDEFNDLNKPCRIDGERVSPAGTCGGPPGDGDGSDAGVVVEWAENVSAGQRLVIQERNAPGAYDVLQAGETISVVYRTEEFTVVIARTVIEPSGDA